MKSSNYQTANQDNRIFRDLILSIIGIITAIYYGTAKVLGTEKGMNSIDIAILIAIATGAAWFMYKVVKMSQLPQADK